MARIFVNYRRDDAAGAAGRLYDHLARHFSKSNLFMDVDAMKPGFDFVKQLDEQVSKCDALLAVIGSKWLEARDETGRRRLDNDTDYVRVEIASALKRDIAVIPILVDGAAMPVEQALPDDLKSLARRHGVELRHTRFNVDADVVVAALRSSLPRPSRGWILPTAAAGLVAACGVLVVVLWPQISALVAPLPKEQEPVLSDAEKHLRSIAARKERFEAVKKDRLEADVRKKPPTIGSGAKLEGISVGLGDTMDAVKRAYPSGSVSDDQVYLPLSGIRFIFDKDNLTLRTIRLDVPFSGSIQGLRIGDSLDNVLRIMGQPYTQPWDFAGNQAYAFNVGDTVVRFDIDKSHKISTVFYFPRN